MHRPHVSLITALAAFAASIGGRFMQGKRTLRSMGLKEDGGVPASRNYGYTPGRGNRAYQRAALKRRNVIRHRKACRG
jgi:hypothetical protein